MPGSVPKPVLYFIFKTDSHSVTQSGMRVAISTHGKLCLPGASNSPASASREAGFAGACHQVWLIVVFLVKTGFRHVG